MLITFGKMNSWKKKKTWEPDSDLSLRFAKLISRFEKGLQFRREYIEPRNLGWSFLSLLKKQKDKQNWMIGSSWLLDNIPTKEKLVFETVNLKDYYFFAHINFRAFLTTKVFFSGYLSWTVCLWWSGTIKS